MDSDKSITNTRGIKDTNKLTLTLNANKNPSRATDVVSEISSGCTIISQCKYELSQKTPTETKVHCTEEAETIAPVECLSDIEVAYMERAFYYAREALDNQEVPVGCIFVYKGDIVALGRNTVNETRNATRHAEINCIEQVTDYCRDKRLDLKEVFSDIGVYVTVEPCIMCAAALYDLNVSSIVFGCKNDRFGGRTVLDVGALVKPRTTVKGGYREDEAMDLLKTFYKGTNPNAPPSKVKVKKDV